MIWAGRTLLVGTMVMDQVILMTENISFGAPPPTKKSKNTSLRKEMEMSDALKKTIRDVAYILFGLLFFAAGCEMSVRGPETHPIFISIVVGSSFFIFCKVVGEIHKHNKKKDDLS